MFLFPKQENIFRAALVLSGDAPTGHAAQLLKELAASGTPLIAADGGADHLAALGLTPTAIMGDEDSMEIRFPNVPRITHPRAKNFTDGHFAMEYALSHYQGSIAVFGAMGGRLDMHLHNLLLPVFLPFETERVQFFDADTEAAFCEGSCTVTGNAGDCFSFIPLSKISGMKLTGFEYPLYHFGTTFGDSRGISNVMNETTCDISLTEGTVIMIHFINESR